MEQLPGLIKDLALILIAAALVTLIFKKIKQPLILGYILAGFLVGPYMSLTPTVVDSKNIETLAKIGVIFLLFSLGLEFSFKKLIRVGGSVLLTAIIEILATTISGYFLGRLMGWSFMDSLFLGGMVASSSTIIIIKAFDELGMKTKQFAQIVVGVLIIEDIVMILLMVMLSTVAVTRHFEGEQMLLIVGKLVFFLGLWLIMGIFLIPTFFKRTIGLMNEETLLILAVGMCLGMVVLAVTSGFSAEFGAFIMGSILAETVNAERIEKIFNPVKDLFASIFFVSVGMMIDPKVIVENIGPVVAVTLLLIVGKLSYVTIGALISGQPLKQSMEVGMSMAQIGEFAFIVASLGLSLGVISPVLFPVAVGVSAITTFTTPYLIKFSEPAYVKLEKRLPEYLKRRLSTYSSSAQNIQAESRWRTVVFSYLRIILPNIIILSALLLFSNNFIIPFFEKHIENVFASKFISLTVCLSLASPFLWALIARKPDKIAYKGLWVNPKYSRGPLLMTELLRLGIGILFITLWVGELFTTTGVLISIPAIIALLIIFSKRIQRFYRRLEMRFLDNLNDRERAEMQKKRGKIKIFASETTLSSWDAHLVDMEVNPLAAYIGRHLIDLQWREKYGVNIAYIRRGEKVIYAPKRHDRILPFDHIGVIATDDQMKVFQNVFDEKELSGTRLIDVNDIVLFKLTVDQNNKLNGQSIRGSQIRERTNGLVVGIEREQQRILNPESEMVFKWGDIIWIVGDRKELQKLSKSG